VSSNNCLSLEGAAARNVQGLYLSEKSCVAAKEILNEQFGKQRVQIIEFVYYRKTWVAVHCTFETVPERAKLSSIAVES